MSQLREDLIAAKALIDTPEKWCQGGYNIGTSLCALGAVTKQCSGAAGYWSERADPARRLLVDSLPRYWRDKGVAAFNDSPKRKHADIMALFDRAIKAAS